ncbi:hypothetical protein EVG20_g10208 [Dentipellis fragilis]|uniref:G-alpha-domain-containing protein n=1 Tax=Dentipellis fragilis TaxID=205917 RepID=A0A4Y9XT57_9AGAM|nr:hypothetical protein EVG20_g10208 [Dentipellis fragilis]
MEGARARGREWRRTTRSNGAGLGTDKKLVARTVACASFPCSRPLGPGKQGYHYHTQPAAIMRRVRLFLSFLLSLFFPSFSCCPPPSAATRTPGRPYLPIRKALCGAVRPTAAQDSLLIQQHIALHRHTSIHRQYRLHQQTLSHLLHELQTSPPITTQRNTPPPLADNQSQHNTMAPVASITDRDDPLTRALAPPPDETPSARRPPPRRGGGAKALGHDRRGAQPGAACREEKPEARQDPPPRCVYHLRVLVRTVLSQSESGKSTTLKNFQLMASPKAFKTERIVWRAVIQLNVVRSIHLVLDTLADLHAQQLGRPSSSPAPSPPVSEPMPELTPEHLRLKMRLSPLLQVEETLVRKLSARGLGSERDREVSVSGSGWKGRFGRIIGGVEAARNSVESARTHSRTPSLRSRAQSRAGVEGEDDSGIDWDDPEDPGRVIHACGEDMMKLWADPVIRRALEMQKMRLQEMSGFFLDSLDRVAQLRYIPTDDDILRARIKTLGVTEYRFMLNQKNSMVSRDWVVFDVGGHRSLVRIPTGASETAVLTDAFLHSRRTCDVIQRAAWVPYFDDMNAIIFLAPISCFDQVLEEDERVNRLEDSVLLWNTIVANPLLARTTMVLFLNKCDILREKLEAGIQFGRYITSYGDRPNDFESTSNYLKRKFTAVHKEKSPSPRPYYCHLTSVTDTKTTHLILWDVAESILRVNLEKSALIV